MSTTQSGSHVANEVIDVLAEVFDEVPASEIENRWTLVGGLRAETHELLLLRWRLEKRFGIKALISPEEEQKFAVPKNRAEITVDDIINRVEQLTIPARVRKVLAQYTSCEVATIELANSLPSLGIYENNLAEIWRFLHEEFGVPINADFGDPSMITVAQVVDLVEFDQRVHQRARRLVSAA